MGARPGRQQDTARPPLVSIGIPTYNRLGTLRRTLESALAQDYPQLEIVVSDNASTDGTQAYCEAVSARDRRVRYLRQQENSGAAANFCRALESSTGTLFMWLADDDWIDADYVSRCVARLLQPGFALVAGRSQYYRGDRWEAQGEPTQLLQDDPAERVVQYFAQVTDNGVLYGITYREYLMAERIPTGIGSDWMLVAALAFRGRVATVEDTSVHRAMEGASDGMAALVRAYRLRGRAARNPYGAIRDAVRDYILWRGAAFRTLGLPGRAMLAWRAAAQVHHRYYVRVRGYNRAALRERLLNVQPLQPLLQAWRRRRAASAVQGPR